MALTAVVATALAAVCAAAALGIPAALVGLALLPGIGLVAARPDRRVLRPGLDVRLLVWTGGIAVLALFVSGVARAPEHYAAIATGAVVAIIPLSLLWPAPAVVRASLLLAAGSLMGALPSTSLLSWPVLGVGAGAAVALVALNRLSAAAAAITTGSSGVRRRRVAGEAVILLAIAGLVALLAASLLPPPPNAERQSPDQGERSQSPPQDQPPYLQPTDRLDAGGEGSGKGREVVFRVSAPSAQLWRTTTFDRYDGRTWTRSPDTGDSAGLRQQGEFVFVPASATEQFEDRERLVQRVTVVTGSMGLVAAASQLGSVQLPGGRQARVSGDDTVVPSPPLGRGATYVAVSLVPNPDAVPSTTNTGVPTELRRLYLAVPALPARVADLAESVTAAAASTYEKARALEGWFNSSTEFKRGTAALAPGTDPIDTFLFAEGGGSSEQAASAMTVMLRSLGVPARVAVGYLPGQRSAFGGDFVVRGRDAHAWVEAWFPGAGWVAFDPTGQYAAGSDDSLVSKLRRLLGALWWVLAAAVAAAAAGLAWRLVRWWRRQHARPWATRCYERLTRAGRRLGRPRKPYETPLEYCTALAADVPDDRLVQVGDLLTAAAFARDHPPSDARTWADEVVAATELSAHRKPGRVRAPVP